MPNSHLQQPKNSNNSLHSCLAFTLSGISAVPGRAVVEEDIHGARYDNAPRTKVFQVAGSARHAWLGYSLTAFVLHPHPDEHLDRIQEMGPAEWFAKRKEHYRWQKNAKKTDLLTLQYYTARAG